MHTHAHLTHTCTQTPHMLAHSRRPREQIQLQREPTREEKQGNTIDIEQTKRGTKPEKKCIHFFALNQWLSVESDFCPPRNIWQCLKTFLVITTEERGYYCHPVSGSQPSHSAWDGPTRKNCLFQNSSSAQAGKPCLTCRSQPQAASVATALHILIHTSSPGPPPAPPVWPSPGTSHTRVDHCPSADSGGPQQPCPASPSSSLSLAPSAPVPTASCICVLVRDCNQVLPSEETLPSMDSEWAGEPGKAPQDRRSTRASSLSPQSQQPLGGTGDVAFRCERTCVSSVTQPEAPLPHCPNTLCWVQERRGHCWQKLESSHLLSPLPALHARFESVLSFP